MRLLESSPDECSTEDASESEDARSLEGAGAVVRSAAHLIDDPVLVGRKGSLGVLVGRSKRDEAACRASHGWCTAIGDAAGLGDTAGLLAEVGLDGAGHLAVHALAQFLRDGAERLSGVVDVVMDRALR